jgi:hypothetical protein
MHDWTPGSSLLGGGLIGLAASLLLLGTGRIAGISGILGALVLGSRAERIQSALFLLGLVAAGFGVHALAPDTIAASPRSPLVVAVGGVLVGIGTRLGRGCTSGHGVCGISRGSPRSLVATLVFLSTGMLTVGVVHWLLFVPAAALAGSP